MSWHDTLKGDPFSWLLEESDIGVRYLTLRDLMDLPSNDKDLMQAKQLAHTSGPIAHILNEMHPEGYWVEAGPGYNPKYRSSVWSLILLGQLGSDCQVDERIKQGCTYYLEHALTTQGQFSIGGSGAPSGTVDCLQGNMCTAFLNLAFTPPQLDLAFEWMARSVTGEGVAPLGEKNADMRYYAGKCGPNFACGANDKQACAWGAAKVMLAFAKLPKGKRTPLIERAIQQGVDFFFSVNPASAEWPHAYAPKPSGNWWKLGFPVFYITDLLQVAEALALLGYGHDPRLADTMQIILDKQDAQGRWALEIDYSDKTWLQFGAKKQPSKWVTLRALHVLKLIG